MHLEKLFWVMAISGMQGMHYIKVDKPARDVTTCLVSSILEVTLSHSGTIAAHFVSLLSYKGRQV